MLENPVKTWWKVKKYFKFPNIKFRKYDRKDFDYWYFDRLNKFISFQSYDVQWKSKFNSPRHEYNPIIRLVLFRRIGFILEFTYGELDTCTWETILDFLYFEPFKGNLKESIENNIWGDFENNKIDCKPNIRKKYLKLCYM